MPMRKEVGLGRPCYLVAPEGSVSIRRKNLRQPARYRARRIAVSVAIFLLAFSFLSWSPRILKFSHPLSAETKIRQNKSPLVDGLTFNCLECDANSMPLPGLNATTNCTYAYESLYEDQTGQRCAFCHRGAYTGPVGHSHLDKTSIARRLLLEDNFHEIHIVGSSIQRHVYINLVASFRANHGFGNETLIEHFFHTHSSYAFNGTDDEFIVGGKLPQIERPTHIVKFVWDEKLHNNYTGQKHPRGTGKTMLVLGNHFWNYEFHDGIINMITSWSNLYRELSQELVVIWLYTWLSPNPKLPHSGNDEKIRELNRQAKLFLDAQKKDNNKLMEEGAKKVKYIGVDVEQIFARMYGEENATTLVAGWTMIEDGMHFQCNFKYWYSGKFGVPQAPT